MLVKKARTKSVAIVTGVGFVAATAITLAKRYSSFKPQFICKYRCKMWKERLVCAHH